MRTRNDGATSDSDYRPDIDGLRAVAVLSVIAFHLYKPLLPGGFTGVDIFFVISGYLISRNILREMDTGSFSLLEFYRRRVKRIAPAMLLVVAVTLVLAESLMLPEDARTTAKAAVASVASLANVYFWLNTDNSYFAPDTAQLPLLHLWSLGVEEQFYACWPLALLLTYRTRRSRRFALAIVALAVGSFGLAQALVRPFPEFTYYMLPTRAGELGLGALAALAAVRGLTCPAKFAGVVASGSAGLLLASLVVLNDRVPFPGFASILPTLATAGLIFAGERVNPVSRLLGIKVIVFVGVVSYSAYLWHWPLLALYRYGYGSPTFVPSVAIVGATFLLAWLTYRFIETPTRRSRASAVHVISTQYAVPAILLAAVALCMLYPSTHTVLTLHSREYQARLASLRNQNRPAFMFAWTCQRQRLTVEATTDSRCVLGAGTGRPADALLWGDSNAAQYIQMIEAFAKQGGFRFRNVEIGSCPPLLGDSARFVELRRTLDCKRSLEVVRPILARFPVVILGASWTAYARASDDFLPTFFDTVRDLTREGKRVILLAKAPEIAGFDRLCRQKAMSYPFLSCPPVIVPVSEDVMKVNSRLREFAEQTPNVQFFDATKYLCPAGICRAYDSRGNSRYFDHGHIGVSESQRLGEEILAAEGIPLPFREQGSLLHLGRSREEKSPASPEGQHSRP